MNMEVLSQRIKTLEQRQEQFVLREVFDIFKGEIKDIRQVAYENRNTNMKLMGALVLFKIVYAPLVFMVLQAWMEE